MAGIKIHELSTGSVSANDSFVFDTGTACYKIPFSDLQDAIQLGLYTSVSDWNDLKPGASRQIVHGYSTGGTASNVPVSGDNITYYGYAEGVTTYFTQHIFTMYTGSTVNRNRYWIRQCLNSTFGDWQEVTKNWWNQDTVTNLDNVTAAGLYTFASTATGIPTGWGNTSGRLLVYGGSTSYVYQTAFRMSAAIVPTVYHRAKGSDGWGQWHLLDATGKNITGGEVRTQNIDDFPTYGVFGVWWVVLSSSALSGTLPYSTGQGVLVCLKQSSDVVRQCFIPAAVTKNQMVCRYYTISTGVWSAWATGMLVGGVKSKDYTFTDSASGGGGAGIVKEISISSLGGTPLSAVATSGTSANFRMVSAAFDTNRNVMRVTADNMTGSPGSFTITVYYV